MIEKTIGPSCSRRTQNDYSLAFKLQVINEVERAIIRTKRPNVGTAFKAGAPFWFGYEDMVFYIGNLLL